MGPRTAAQRLISVGDRLLPMPTGVTVLIYHTVGADDGGAVDVEIDEFRGQLEHLAEHHRVISLGAAAAELASDGDPVDGVVITFDDGTADFVEHAVPALVDAGLPATLYACTQAIDEQQPFPWGAPPQVGPGCATQRQQG